MRASVVLVTGAAPAAMAATQLSLLWDLPHAVAVRHHIDLDRGVLERVVSDLGGVVEREEVTLEHACVSCALREDVLPTLDRLARDGRWRTIVAQLPVGAEGEQVCSVLAWDPALARRLKVAAVVAAVDGASVVEDLLGDDTLADRGLASSHDDERGLGEVACSMVEYADVVVAHGVDEAAVSSTSGTARALLQVLARPDVPVVQGADLLAGADLLQRPPHQHARTRAWSSHLRDAPVPPAPRDDVWTLDLHADAPFHPERLLEHLEELASGPFRTRGCFWLPTRPDQALLWEGAGGHLAIGAGEAWGRRPRRTRLTYVGVGSPPAHLAAAFESLLLAPAAYGPGIAWHLAEDGFEPWLGPLRDVA
ncbi:GTP-binding protein [Nocardioides zeae]|uniref:GTP-binding protein n=1 Tax=Nocardioides imazamoxiresistens TaxID=3231893 RepID=A0ABU3PXT0_9ACTN|nr:GTP-binding protein [Nocardioides zeae]MDT9593622.1 GTP-binding protein [Nocardioides zeae]